MNNKYKIYLPIVLAIVLIAGIIIGTNLNSDRANSNNIMSLGHPKINKIDNILDYIERNYVDSVSRDILEKDAINSMLEELDPHSAYITAEEFHQINDPLMGSFEGIGIAFRIEKDSITVINTIPGGPSEKVGLMAGDRIVLVDDTLIAGIGVTNNKAIKKLKGPKGTKVKVTVFRRGLSKLLDYNIIRDVIPTFSLDVAYMVNDEIGYIKLNKFSATTYDEFKKALDKLLAQNMEKLILDLRGNPGGFLNAAINIADEFLKDGQLIVYTEGKNRPKNYAYANGKGEFIDKDLVILVNEGSASASEIVAGAIQDNDRGTVIGRRSFGKGLVQEQMNMPDGSAIRLTVAKYHTPTGRCIQRPYEKEEFKDYFEESYHRYLTGEMQSADSIFFNDSLKYITKGGKVVYGGGGIMPDIYVPLSSDTSNKLYNILANKGVLFQFAFDYTDRHREELNNYTDFKKFDRNFNMTNKEFADLLEFAEEKGVDYSKEEARTSKSKIKILFKAFVGRNVLNEDGFYPSYHKIDDIFKRAMEELSE